jgi:NAD(P)-dependent dehydrogenase (short-subunit alcohol dehydrogenase family)
MGRPTSPAAGRVAGKVALVTGAASGIGRAAALALAAHGAAVACADRDDLGLAETVADVAAAGGSAWGCPLDVTSEPAWERATDQILRERGRLDVAVNCAGVSFAAPVADTALEDWRRVMAVNLEGTFLGTKHAVRAMRRAGRGGSIVNVASVSGVKAQPGASAYCASKAAVIMLSRCAALECRQAGDRIRVNSLSPGGVKTPMWRTMPFFQELMAAEGGEEAAFAAMARAAPHGRWAQPEEVALAVLYLASDESDFVTGTNLLFDNGDTA